MNWMGGARNRVKFQDERKHQQVKKEKKKQEFFDKQRLKVLSSKSSSFKKQRMSQDLLALHTVSRAHSQFPTVNNASRRPIRKLDLEKFQSCTRKIDDVDLGPCSPSTPASKLLLNDSTMDKKSKETSLFKNISGNGQGHSTQNIPGLCPPASCLDVMETKRRQASLTTDMKCTRADPSIPFAFSRPENPKLSSAMKNQLKFDPYASEDFQVTPLVHYHQKKKSPLEEKLKNVKKKKHHENQVGPKSHPHGNQVDPQSHPYGNQVGPKSHPHGNQVGPQSHPHGNQVGPQSHPHGNQVGPQSHPHGNQVGPQSHPYGNQVGPQSHPYGNQVGPQSHPHGNQVGPQSHPHGNQDGYHSNHKVNAKGDAGRLEKGLNFYDKGQKFTSTPAKDPTHLKQYESDIKLLSPIMKESPMVHSTEAEFHFQPRPMKGISLERSSFESRNSSKSLSEWTQRSSFDQNSSFKPFIATKLNTETPDLLTCNTESSYQFTERIPNFDKEEHHDNHLLNETTTLEFKDEFQRNTTSTSDTQDKLVIWPNSLATKSSLSQYRQTIYDNRNEEVNKDFEEECDYRGPKFDIADKERVLVSSTPVRALKPNFTDLDDDFQYTPPRCKKSRLTDNSSNIMNMYTTSYERDATGGELNTAQTRKMRQLSGGSVGSLPSPKEADVFPGYLQRDNCETENVGDKQCMSVRKLKQVKSRESDTSSNQYKTLKPGTSELLNEICELEAQDSSQNSLVETHDDRLFTTPPGGKCSESFEAETFIDNEEKLMDVDIAYFEANQTKKQITKKQITDTSKAICQELPMTKCEAEQGIDVVVDLTCYEETSFEPEIIELKTDFETCGSAGQGKSVKEKGKSKRALDDTDNIKLHGSKEIEDTTVKHKNSGSAESQNDNISGTSCKGEGVHKIKDTFGGDPRNKCDQINVLELKKMPRSFDEIVIECRNETLKAESDKVETDSGPYDNDTKHTSVNQKNDELDAFNKKPLGSVVNPVTTDASIVTVQDPEISSGRSRYTQTEECESKEYTDASTSPLQRCDCTFDKGIQCEINHGDCYGNRKIPSLSSLVVTSLQKRANTTV